jgi:hypothetical protein
MAHTRRRSIATILFGKRLTQAAFFEGRKSSRKKGGVGEVCVFGGGGLLSTPPGAPQGRPFRPPTGFYITPSGPSELPSRWTSPLTPQGWWVSARVRAHSLRWQGWPALPEATRAILQYHCMYSPLDDRGYAPSPWCATLSKCLDGHTPQELGGSGSRCTPGVSSTVALASKQP